VKTGKSFPEKLEQLLAHIEYHESQVFRNPADISYEDGYISFQGELLIRKLFDFNSSEEVNKELIQPGLGVYRNIS
jgi:hypothetical protein